MTIKLVALAGAALSLLLVSSQFDPADAHRRSGSGGGPRVASGGGGPGYIHNGHRHRHRFHGHRFIFAAPLVYGTYAYGDGCHWLWRNAQETGSRYWWNRYNACLDDYGY